MEKQNFMDIAVQKSIESVKNGGGPFGAVIVKDNQIIAAVSNSVVPSKDPTAHAEVNAIRKACQELGTHDLKGCVIYSSCEPCLMCLGAIYWARLDHLYFSNTINDAKNAGFDDELIYIEITKQINERAIKTERLPHEKAIVALNDWKSKTNKIDY